MLPGTLSQEPKLVDWLNFMMNINAATLRLRIPAAFVRMVLLLLEMTTGIEQHVRILLKKPNYTNKGPIRADFMI